MTDKPDRPLVYEVRYSDPEWEAETEKVKAFRWIVADDLVSFVDRYDRSLFAVHKGRVITIELVEDEDGAK